jgi:PKD repeat protein
LIKKRLAVLFIALAGSVAQLSAQHPYPAYPLPSTQPVPCTTCSDGLSTWYFTPPPITAFKGRFVDSTRVRDHQDFPRTFRARDIKIDSKRDRVYMILGQRLVAWSTASFYQKLGGPMEWQGMRITQDVSTQYPGEIFLPFDAYVDAEARGSGWSLAIADSQERLQDFDFDDRGYIYLGYSLYGLGIVSDTSAGMMPRLTQRFSQSGEVNPGRVLSFKVGSSYYLAVTSKSDPHSIMMFDVTNPASITKIRDVTLRTVEWSKISTPNGDIIGHIDPLGRFRIFSAQTFLTGGTAELSDLKVYGTLANDGTNFYAISGDPRGGSRIDVYTWRPSVSGTPASYTSTLYSFPDHIGIKKANFGGGYLTIVGDTSFQYTDLRLFKVNNGVPEPVDLKSYFKNYYSHKQPGHTIPQGYTGIVWDALVHSHQGKDYLMWAGNGLGDVYELGARSSATIIVDAALGYGTPNSFSPNANSGPYFGDTINFRAIGEQGRTGVITWDNPEALVADQTSVVTLAPGGALVPKRYSGLPTKASRRPGIAALGDTFEMDLALPLPRARIGLTDGQTFFAEGSSSSVNLLVGERLRDASDGTIQSHFSLWKAGATESKRLPNDPWPASGCGTQPITLESHYVRYDPATLAALDPATYVRQVQLTANVKPYEARIGAATSTTTTVTFADASRAFPAVTPSAFASGAQWQVEWKLFAAANEPAFPAGQEPTHAAQLPVGQKLNWTVDRDLIKAGRRVQLTISMAPDQFTTESACGSLAGQNGQVVSQQTMTLTLPDPQVSVPSSCQYAGSTCQVSVISLTGQSDWNWYIWTVTSPSGAVTVTEGASLKTINPVLNQAGTWTFKLTARNVLGETSHQVSHAVAEQLCSTGVFDFAINWSGAGCSIANPCTTPQELHFSPSSFTYTFRDGCDTFLWTFPGGATSTARNPSFDFSSLGNGPHTVSLKVTNPNATKTVTTSISFASAPPPPPPPPPCSAPPQTGILMDYSGSNGCSPLSPEKCVSNAAINFSVTTWGYTIQTCDSFSWQFGDGTGASGRNVTKTYAQAGTYTVTITLTNSAGTRSYPQTFVVGQGGGGSDPGGCPTTAPGSMVSATHVGSTSGCTDTNGVSCLRTEQITFTAAPWQYNIQDCDTVEWTFPNGVVKTGKTVTHQFGSIAGNSASYTLKISNSKGTRQANLTVNLATSGVTPPAGVAISGAPETATVGASVNLSGSAASGTVTNWHWDFGDSTTATTQNVTKSWDYPGNFLVTLTASNEGGSAVASTRVLVTEGRTYAFMLPAVAHIAGQNGSQWRTDLQIFIPNSDLSKPVELEMEFKGQKKTLTVDRSTYIREDLMRFFTTSDDAGPVIVRGVSATVPQMWTRTYNQNASGVGTYGQLIPAVPISTQAAAVTGATRLLLPGLRSTDRFRTNLGLVNINTVPVELTITAYDEQYGRSLGSFTTTVNPFSLSQIGNLWKIDDLNLGRFEIDAPARPYTLRVVNNAGLPFIAYGSMIDNISNDPVYITAISDADTRDVERKVQILPGVGRSGSWRSDVTIFNADGQGIQFDLSYYDQSGEKIAEAKNLALHGNTFMQLDDFLRAGVLTPEPAAESIGMLKVETKVAGVSNFPIVYARTYNDQGPLGTFGQGIGAFAAAKANVLPGKHGYIAGIRYDTAYRTNVGLVSTGEATVVRVILLDPISGEGIGERVYDLAANQSLIQPNIFEAVGVLVDRASLKIEVVSGGAVWAFASVIDQLTSDPEYVPAVTAD